MSATGGGTPWASLTVEQMWAMLHGQDQAGYDRLIQGWQQTADVADRHIDYLEDYRTRLGEAWPPSSSPASRAYHDQLERMIQNMRETWSVALSNRSTLESAAAALASAYTAMDRIQREHTANRASLAQYEQQLLTMGQQYAGRPVATPTSPVADGRQAALQDEARAVMSSLSTDLAMAKFMVRTPARYDLTGSRELEGGDYETVGGSAAAGAGAYVSGAGMLSLSTLKDEQAVRKPKDVNSHPDSIGKISPSTAGSSTPGPTLVGAGPAATAHVTSPAHTVYPTTLPDSATSHPAQAPLGSGRFTGSGPSRHTPTAQRTSGAAMVMPSEPFSRNQPALPNGILGGPPAGSGTPVSRGSTGGVRPVQRANPVGGVIGDVPPSMRTGSGGIPGNSGVVGNRARRSSEDEDEAAGRSWDPDNPWETDVGVAPVLDAPPPHRVDPGPAIGLGRS